MEEEWVYGLGGEEQRDWEERDEEKLWSGCNIWKKDEKKFYKNKIHSKMYYLVSLWLTDNSPASKNDKFHYRVHKTIILGCDITL